MRKFYIQHLKGKVSILEIEGELCNLAQSRLYLKDREYAFNITKPESLKGERYMWFALADTESEALKIAYHDIEKTLAMKVRKGQVSHNELPALVLQEKEAIEFLRLKK